MFAFFLKKTLKNHRQSRFRNLWYQFFLPYDFGPEINNFKCFKVYEGHPRGFRSFLGWFLAILGEPIQKMVDFQKTKKFDFSNFFVQKWVEWPGLGMFA